MRFCPFSQSNYQFLINFLNLASNFEQNLIVLASWRPLKKGCAFHLWRDENYDNFSNFFWYSKISWKKDKLGSNFTQFCPFLGNLIWFYKLSMSSCYLWSLISWIESQIIEGEIISISWKGEILDHSKHTLSNFGSTWVFLKNRSLLLHSFYGHLTRYIKSGKKTNVHILMYLEKKVYRANLEIFFAIWATWIFMKYLVSLFFQPLWPCNFLKIVRKN